LKRTPMPSEKKISTKGVDRRGEEYDQSEKRRGWRGSQSRPQKEGKRRRDH